MAGRLKRFLSLFQKHWPKAKEIPNSTCSHLYEFSVLRGCHGEWIEIIRFIQWRTVVEIRFRSELRKIFWIYC
jgi:hypothetical protein